METAFQGYRPSDIAGLLGPLPGALRDRLIAAGSKRIYQDGQFIQAQGDVIRGLSIILSGTVRMGLTDTEGRIVSTVLRRPGDSFGELTLFANLPRALNAEAVGQTEIAYISADAFTRVMDEAPALRDFMLSNLTHQLAQALEQIENLVRLPVPLRVTKVLINQAQQADVGAQAWVETTQEQLANALGLTRVTVSSVLKTLKQQGLIETGYGVVKIPDLAALRAFADGADLGSNPD